VASPSIGKLSSMYLHAWKAGLKTTYYLRSRPATRIQLATVTTAGAPSTSTAAGTPSIVTAAGVPPAVTTAGTPSAVTTAGTPPADTADAAACALENPGACEACQ
jgi:ribonucleoside-diphosphate reductase alpha chain